MSHLSPPATQYDDSSESSQAVSWTSGAPALHFEDAVVETVTTQIIRKTTSFRPINLPRIPSPAKLSLPSHLPEVEYPLSSAPDRLLGPINVSVSGHRISFSDVTADKSPAQLVPGQTWARIHPVRPSFRSMEADILHSSQHRPLSGVTAATPPRTEGKSRSRADSRGHSPPRKRVRGAELTNHGRGTQGPLPSPLPSPQPDSPPFAAGTSHAPSAPGNVPGGELAMATLLSLPAMLEHFDQLNDKAKMHVFTHMLRRSKLPILQQVAELASSVLKRDFVSDLPYEITVQMLKYLDTRSLARASMVSKKWARTVNHDRGLWVKRLVAEDLYLGHGVEEEEERTIQRRMALIQKHNLPTSGLEWPNPMKHVFRRRFTSANNWLKSKPEIVAFPAIGSPASIMTGTHITQGKIVAARDRKVLHVYDAQTGQLLRRLRGHTAGIWASDVHENRLVTGSTDRSLRVWDLNTGNAHIFRGHTSTVRCAKIVLPVWYEEEQCFQPPCPLVVSGSRDGTLRVWRIPEAGEAYYNDYAADGTALGVGPDRNPYHLLMAAGHTDAIRALAGHGRTMITASYDRSVRVWDVTDGTCKKVLMGHTDKVYSVAYDHHRKRAVSGDCDHTVRVWDVISGECLYVMTGHTALVGSLEMSITRLLHAFSENTLRLHNAEKYPQSLPIESHSAAITAFSHDDVKTICVTNGVIKLHDSRNGRLVRTLTREFTAASHCIIRNNKLVLSVTKDGVKNLEVFNFGKLDHWSGLDDDSLDDIEGPRWKLAMPNDLDWRWYPSFPELKGKMVDSFRPSIPLRQRRRFMAQAALAAQEAETSVFVDEAEEEETSDEDVALFDNDVPMVPVAVIDSDSEYEDDDDMPVVSYELGQEGLDGVDDAYEGQWPAEEEDSEMEEADEEDGEEEEEGVVLGAVQPLVVDSDTSDTIPATYPPQSQPQPLSFSHAKAYFYSSEADPSTSQRSGTAISRTGSTRLQERLQARAEAAIRNAASSASSSPNVDQPGPSRPTRRGAGRGSQQARRSLTYLSAAVDSPTSAHAVGAGFGLAGPSTVPALGGYADTTAYLATATTAALGNSAAAVMHAASSRVTRSGGNRRSAGATAGGSPLPRMPSSSGAQGQQG